jgi:hypothetical protein
MRTLWHIVTAAILTFIGISTASYILFSDGHGFSEVSDGIKRIGWPFMMFERGGLVYRNEFHLAAALGDFAVALCFGAVLYLIVKWGAHEYSRWEKEP